MQYILTEEEYNQIHKDYKSDIEHLNERLLKVCRMAANNYVINPGSSQEYHFKCILNEDLAPFGKGEYCYHCPALKECPWKWKRLPK